MGPRELYYECPEGYIWRPRRRGIFGVTKGYISGSQKGIFGFQEMFFFRRARLGNTCSYIWCTTSSVEPNLNFTRCDEQILFFVQSGNSSMWCLVQRPSNASNRHDEFDVCKWCILRSRHGKFKGYICKR